MEGGVWRRETQSKLYRRLLRVRAFSINTSNHMKALKNHNKTVFSVAVLTVQVLKPGINYLIELIAAGGS